jgi:hypothetical protein
LKLELASRRSQPTSGHFHQQDDLIEPGYLEVLPNTRENPGAALVHCDLVPSGESKALRNRRRCAATAYMRVMTPCTNIFPLAFRGDTGTRCAGGPSLHE